MVNWTIKEKRQFVLAKMYLMNSLRTMYKLEKMVNILEKERKITLLRHRQILDFMLRMNELLNDRKNNARRRGTLIKFINYLVSQEVWVEIKRLEVDYDKIAKEKDKENTFEENIDLVEEIARKEWDVDVDEELKKAQDSEPEQPNQGF